MNRKAGIFVYPRVEELDFAGPIEVLGMVNKVSDNRVEIFAFSERRRRILCTNGLAVHPQHSFEDFPGADILVIPGGPGARSEMLKDSVISFIKSISESCELIISVCTGALMLGAAGLLAGRKATTHWAARGKLEGEFGAQLVDDKVVHDGRIITSSGISTGIDASLYAVKVLFGEEVAESVARRISWRKPWWKGEGRPSLF